MHVFLRKVTEEDIDLLYQWVNDSDVRANSFSTSEISYEEHQKWFRELLADWQRVQYIYVYDGEDVGQVRLTINGDTAEVGYSIRKDRRCMGHGKMLLQLLAEQIKTDRPDVKKLLAKVKPDNIPSQKAFLNTGYVEKYQCFELKLGQVQKE